MKMKTTIKLLLVFLTLLFIEPIQLISAQGTEPSQGNTITFMPFVATPPRVTPYGFATSNGCTGEYSELMPAPITLAYGFKRLGYGTVVYGAVGMTWREEWIVDGQVAEGLATSGVIAEVDELITSSIVFGENGNCGDGVPRGQWIVRLYLDNTLYQEAVVTIQ